MAAPAVILGQIVNKKRKFLLRLKHQELPKLIYGLSLLGPALPSPVIFHAVHCLRRRLRNPRLLLLACAMMMLPDFVHSQESVDPKVVEGARKKGEIIWYTTMSLDQSKEFVDRFQKKYPFLRPTIFHSGGGALLNRVVSESKAGTNLFDVVHGTGEIVLPLTELGLIGSYASPERKMIPEDLKDTKSFWTSVYVNSLVLGYNKNEVKREILPRSYNDLLLPR